MWVLTRTTFICYQLNLKIPKKEKMIKLNKLTASISLYTIGILFSLNVFAAEPLVSVGWLNDNLVNDKVVILDIRNKIDGGSKEIFETGSWINTKKTSCFVPDHCHKTGKFRGYICDDCNTIIARAKENIQTLRNIADSLEQDLEL